ncbi:MAG TPA: S1 RNA-binding domain-containing protein [Ktedonobacteraceae bacterium]
MDEPQQPANVWEHADERYQAGQKVQGVVTRVAQFGIFVQVESGLEGIIYAFELGSGPAALTTFTPGQEIQLFVKNIDISRKRLELSLDNALMPELLDERALPLPLHRQLSVGEQSRSIPPQLLPNIPAITRESALPACPGCLRQVQTNWKFCVYCGAALQCRCPACGNIQPALPDARFCFACGQAV